MRGRAFGMYASTMGMSHLAPIRLFVLTDPGYPGDRER